MDKKIKLGVSYNCFDDSIDLLEGSIKSIRNVADYVTVIYQNVSNMNNPAEMDIKNLLDELKEKGLVDSYHEFIPKFNVNTPHINELNKRNIGLFDCEGVGCTHFMSMDCDEYYEENKLIKAFKEIIEGDYDSSACQLQTYWKTGEYVLDPPEDYYVSLIYKIRNNVKLEFGVRLPVLVDPTRVMEPGKCRIFKRDELEMHHVSYVRKNIARKLYNSSSISVFNDRIEKLISDFNNWEYGDIANMPGGTKHNVKKVKNILEWK